MIDFESKYATDGVGLQNVVAGSGERYISGWNEGTSKIFPSFNQPNIMGTLKLFVAAPDHWMVSGITKKSGYRLYTDAGTSSQLHSIDFMRTQIHTDLLKNKGHSLTQELTEKVQKNYPRWAGSKFQAEAHQRLYFSLTENQAAHTLVREFETTQPLPAYLYTVYAGPWDYIKIPGSNTKLLCTKGQYTSLLRMKDKIGKLTKFGLDFYSKLFGVPYKFGKYDYTFVPTINSKKGQGMAYPGNVMLCESLIDPEGQASDGYDLICLIFQKMALMWLGTHRPLDWWDDLYLKDSLADFSRVLCYEAYYKEFSGTEDLRHPA